MNIPARIALGVSAAVIAGTAAFAVIPAIASASTTAAESKPAVAEPPAPTPTEVAETVDVGVDGPLTVLPEWARDTLWIVYPEGFKCAGTEGCPNDYRALFGEPGPVLPKGVEIYDPTKHFVPAQ